MLSEKLMEVLDSIQKSILLQPEKKLAYAAANNFSIFGGGCFFTCSGGCSGCSGSCSGGCSGGCSQPCAQSCYYGCDGECDGPSGSSGGCGFAAWDT